MKLVNFENFPKSPQRSFSESWIFLIVFSGGIWLFVYKIRVGWLAKWKIVQAINEIICNSKLTTFDNICWVLPKICFWNCSTANKATPTLYTFFIQKSLGPSRFPTKNQAKKEDSDSMGSFLNPSFEVRSSVLKPLRDTLLFWCQVRSCL